MHMQSLEKSSHCPHDQGTAAVPDGALSPVAALLGVAMGDGPVEGGLSRSASAAALEPGPCCKASTPVFIDKWVGVLMVPTAEPFAFLTGVSAASCRSMMPLQPCRSSDELVLEGTFRLCCVDRPVGGPTAEALRGQVVQRSCRPTCKLMTGILSGA